MATNLKTSHPVELEQPAASAPADPWQAAIEFGIDTSLIDFRLEQTVFERLHSNDRAAESFEMLREAGRKLHGPHV